MADRRKSMFVPFTKGDQVWLDSRNLKTIYSITRKWSQNGKDHFHCRSTGTGYLQVATSSDLVNPWWLPCCITTTIQGERDLWRELCEATSRVRGRWRGLRRGNNPKSQEKRTRLSIFCQMVGISNHRCLMVIEHTFSNDSDTLTHYKLRHSLDPRPFPHYAFFWPTNQCELGIRSLLGNAAWNPW